MSFHLPELPYAYDALERCLGTRVLLKYQNKRANWVEAWWNLVKWEDVLKRFEDNADTVQW